MFHNNTWKILMTTLPHVPSINKKQGWGKIYIFIYNLYTNIIMFIYSPSKNFVKYIF